jgi:tetratricopeptide (TPR) repeat protein
LIKNTILSKSLGVVFLFVLFLSLEQRAGTDTSLRRQHTDLDQVKAVLDRVEKLYRNQPSQAMRMLEELGPANRLNTSQRGRWHLLKSKCYQRQNKYQQSIEEALLAETSLHKYNDSSDLMGCYSIKGNAYFHLLALDASAECYRKAVHLAVALGRKDAEADLTLNLGNIYAQQKDWNQAGAYYRDALHYYQKSNDPMVSYVLNNLGVVEEMNRRYREAKNLYIRAWRLDTQLRDSMAIASDLINLGDVCLKLQQCQESLHYLRQALNISNALGNGGYVSRILMLQAESHLRCGGGRDSALHYAREVIRSVEQYRSEDTLNLRKAHAMLASQLTAIGKTEEAVPHYNAWRLLDSLVQAREAHQKLLEIQASYHSEHLQRKSERLEFEKILLQTRSERLHATNLALAGALLLSLSVGALLYYRQKALRNREPSTNS